MTKKKAFLQTRFGIVILNVAIAVGILVVVLVSVHLWLQHYTQHGIEVVVPNVTGMQYDEAQQCLADSCLQLVIIDSTFSNTVPLGTIVEQIPEAGGFAKKDRPVYAIINSSYHRQVEIPDLHDISYRQAQATLRSMGILVGKVEYEPSEYRDIVLDLRYQGRPLIPGEKINEGTSITMVVGKGKGTIKVKVPSLQGKSLTEARSLLINVAHLTLGLVQYDEPPVVENMGDYIIYRQSPTPGTSVVEGTGVDVNLTLDIEKAITNSSDDPGEDDFF